MSPASKSKSKDKLAARLAKEQPKAASTFSSGPASSGNGIPGSAYNPVSGTFHTLDTIPSTVLPAPQSNGRFRTIDETDEHSGSSLGTAADFDSLSNNGSYSGESEDQKEKATAATAPRAEPIPGSDTDKREKIRQKNERKHQRQRERRAQELHERCTGYLMSRKLEALAQKLVSMGFSSERATMALIFNEGRVEESVAWLFDGGEESKQQSAANLDGANLKIDIADELAQITALEMKFKCTKQDVERAVVACEGDLEKAEDSLKVLKQEPAVVITPKSEQSGDPVSSANELSGKPASSIQSPAGKVQAKGVMPTIVQQPRRDDRDFNYSKAAATASVQVEPTNRSLQSLRKILSKPTDWGRPQVAAPLDKRWSSASSSPSVSYPLASPLQAAVPQAKSEARYSMNGGHEVKSIMPAGTLKEPIIMMQRPQSVSMKQNLPSTSMGLGASPPASTGWYPNGAANIEMMKMAAANGGAGHQLRNLSLTGSASQQFYPQNHYQSFVSSPMESSAQGWGGGSWSSTGTSARAASSLAVPSSLGLFTSWGSSGSSGTSSPVDWSTGGSMPQCDYTSIDWSLDSTPLTPRTLKVDQLYGNGTWSTTFMGAKALRPPPVVNGGGGLQDGSLVADPSASAGSHEWTNPFNGMDLFWAPRQFATSPSL